MRQAPASWAAPHTKCSKAPPPSSVARRLSQPGKVGAGDRTIWGAWSSPRPARACIHRGVGEPRVNGGALPPTPKKKCRAFPNTAPPSEVSHSPPRRARKGAPLHRACSARRSVFGIGASLCGRLQELRPWWRARPHQLAPQRGPRAPKLRACLLCVGSARAVLLEPRARCAAVQSPLQPRGAAQGGIHHPPCCQPVR